MYVCTCGWMYVCTVRTVIQNKFICWPLIGFHTHDILVQLKAANNIFWNYSSSVNYVCMYVYVCVLITHSLRGNTALYLCAPADLEQVQQGTCSVESTRQTAGLPQSGVAG